jgi:hypothetical protein
MIDILIQKMQTCLAQDAWNSDDSDNPDLLISPKKDIIIEWNDTGYFEIQRERVSFNDCVIGHTYSLKKNGDASNWIKFQQWYLDGVTSKNFRSDAPVKRTEVEIDGDTWEYTRWMRAGKGHGDVPFQYFANPELLPTFLNEIIDPYYEAVAGLIRVSKQYQDTSVPHLAITHGLKDKSGYYFVKSFDLWDQTPSRIIQMNLETGQLVIQHFQSALPKDFGQIWHETASQKWNSLL